MDSALVRTETMASRGLPTEKLFNVKDLVELGSIIWRFTTALSRRKRDCSTNSTVAVLLGFSLARNRGKGGIRSNDSPFLAILFRTSIRSALKIQDYRQSTLSRLYCRLKWFPLTQANILPVICTCYRVRKRWVNGCEKLWRRRLLPRRTAVVDTSWKQIGVLSFNIHIGGRNFKWKVT